MFIFVILYTKLISKWVQVYNARAKYIFSAFVASSYLKVPAWVFLVVAHLSPNGHKESWPRYLYALKRASWPTSDKQSLVWSGLSFVT